MAWMTENLRSHTTEEGVTWECPPSSVPRFSRHGGAQVPGAGSGAHQRRHLSGQRSGQRVRESRSAERDQPAPGAKVSGPSEGRQAVPQGGPDPGKQDAAARGHRHVEVSRQTERFVMTSRSFLLWICWAFLLTHHALKHSLNIGIFYVVYLLMSFDLLSCILHISFLIVKRLKAQEVPVCSRTVIFTAVFSRWHTFSQLCLSQRSELLSHTEAALWHLLLLCVKPGQPSMTWHSKVINVCCHEIQLETNSHPGSSFSLES